MSGHSPRSSRKKALEQQLHADRIDRRDAQRIADGAVGRRPAALHQNSLLAAEAHDVPDDQEIAGQLQLLDQRQLALDLLPRALPQVSAIPFPHVPIARSLDARLRRKVSIVSPRATG